MIDVVLVNPKASNVLEVDCRKYISPPLDLLYIAANLEENGFKVGVFDGNVMDGVRHYIDENKPKLIGINAITIHLPKVNKLLSELDDQVVVLVGEHISGNPELLNSINVDYGLSGCCEKSFSELTNYLIKNQGDLSKISGLVSKIDGKLKVNPVKENNFSDLPYPAFNLVDLTKYKYFSLRASRGCPFNCIYCDSTGPFQVHCKKYFLRKPCDVVDEIKFHFEKCKIDLFDFIDDVFTYDKEFVNEFSRLMREINLPVKFTCSTRPDLMNDEIALKLKQAGCIQVCIGVESGSQKIRENLGRKISDKNILDSFKSCRKVGLKTRASALIGLPGETEDEIQDTFALLKQVRPDYILLYPTILLPGSKLTQDLMEKGLLGTDIWVKYMKGETPLPIYIPEGLSYGGISNYLIQGHKNFYLRPGYFIDRLSRSKSLTDVKELVGLIYHLTEHQD